MRGVLFWSKKNNGGFGAGDAEFDPALISHGLVGKNIEAQNFCVELKRAFLIAHRNAAEFNSANHVASFGISFTNTVKS